MLNLTKHAQSDGPQDKGQSLQASLHKKDSANNRSNSPLIQKSCTHVDPIEANLLALDCEMVGVGEIYTSALARIGIVDYSGKMVYHQYVRPELPIKDYRTKYSGIRPKDLKHARPFYIVKKEVAKLIAGKIIIGHDLRYDLDALQIHHPPHLMRDTSKYHPLLLQGNPRSLKYLSKAILNLDIQNGEHCPIEDALTVLKIYKKLQDPWELSIKLEKAAKPSCLPLLEEAREETSSSEPNS